MRFLIMLISLLWVQNTFAFNAQNHRVICQMAYEQLSPSLQQAIDNVIEGTQFKSYALACPWPDQIRRKDNYKHTRYWHYINVPRNANIVSRSHCPKRGCLFTGIDQAQQRLKQDKSDWQALLFLSHFIGDLHQPLHVSYADDRGGNQHKLKFHRKHTNMHALWDGGILKRKHWQKHSNELLLDISQRHKDEWRQGRLEDWMTESLQLTQDAYRLLPKNNQVNNQYVGYFAPKLEQQIQRASVRLASMLEEIYL